MDFKEHQAEQAETTGSFELAHLLWMELAEGTRNPVFYCRAGRVAQRLKRWDAAEDAFLTAEKLDSIAPEAFECLGSLAINRTDRQGKETLYEAINWFQKALLYERNARLLTFLGSAYAALEDIRNATDALEEAISLDSRYEEAFYNLALVKRQENEELAIALLEQAIELDSSYLEAHQHLGVIFHSRNELAKGEYHFTRCVEIDPTDYWSQLYLANSHATQGRIANADLAYQKAIAMRPDEAAGVELYEKFKSMSRNSS